MAATARDAVELGSASIAKHAIVPTQIRIPRLSGSMGVTPDKVLPCGQYRWIAAKNYS